MKKLLDRNRKSQLMAKLHLSLDKYEMFRTDKQLPQNQNLRLSESNDDLTKQLSKLLQQNNKRKTDIKQQLIQGPIEISLTEQMQDLRWRMNILKQNHKKPKQNNLSLTGKQQLEEFNNNQKLTFDELYKMQKEKFSALRERRKAKRLNMQYIQMVGNKESRKDKAKQINQLRFQEQMKLLDQAISL